MAIPPRSSSAGMRSIRRELQRRRPKPLAPKSSAAKKPSVSPSPRGVLDAGREPRPRPPCQAVPSSATSKSGRSTTFIDGPPRRRQTHSSPRSTSVGSPSTLPPSPSATSSVGSKCPPTPDAAALLRPGTAVLVRTRTATLPTTGQVLVLWLRAVIVSPTDAGYEVVYVGNWPPGKPYCTVHVARNHVRMIKASPTTPPAQHPPSTAAPTTMDAAPKEMQPAPRPTTAGKSLRVIRSLFPEIERQARTASP